MDEATDLLRECRPYMKYVAKSFEDIPDGLAPMFYHTLSAEGDRQEGKKFRDLIGRIDKCVSKRPDED